MNLNKSNFILLISPRHLQAYHKHFGHKFVKISNGSNQNILFGIL